MKVTWSCACNQSLFSIQLRLKLYTDGLLICIFAAFLVERMERGRVYVCDSTDFFLEGRPITHKLVQYISQMLTARACSQGRSIPIVLCYRIGSLALNSKVGLEAAPGPGSQLLWCSMSACGYVRACVCIHNIRRTWLIVTRTMFRLEVTHDEVLTGGSQIWSPAFQEVLLWERSRR